MPGSDEPAKHDEQGFALLIVLWALALLALVIGHLIAAGRTEARIAANVLDGARAEVAADGAIHEAVFRLVDPADRTWTADGRLHRMTADSATVLVRIRSVAGRINPNMAPASLLAALLRATGIDPARADATADAIVRWRRTEAMRGAPTATGERSVEGPFQSIDKLTRVPGITPALLQRLRPHLSVFQQAQPDPRYADPIVAAAIVAWRGERVAIPAASSTAASIQTVIIEAVASTADGARFASRAVIRIDEVPPRGYTVLAWNARWDDD